MSCLIVSYPKSRRGEAGGVRAEPPGKEEADAEPKNTRQRDTVRETRGKMIGLGPDG